MKPLIDKTSEPRTRPSLLIRLRDTGDQLAWSEFVEIYTPLIFGHCLRHGLQEADASDVCQETMRTVVRAMGSFEYDPQQGKFRNWLLTVVRSKINNHLASRQRQPEPGSESAIEALLAVQAFPSDQSEWDVEYHRCLFRWAVARVRPGFKDATWQAFWRMAIEQQDGRAVADSLGLSLGAVYVAKSRVLARLRQQIEGLDGKQSAPL